MSSSINTDGMVVFENGKPVRSESAIKSAFESIECAMAFDVRDWYEDRRSAWIYSIVFGISDEEAEWCKRDFRWDDADIERARRFHEQWETAKAQLEGHGGKG